MPKERILYFVNGPHPSKEELEEGEKLGAVFRNAQVAGEGDSLEICDAVAGAVPKAYKNAKGVKVIGGKKGTVEDKPEGKPEGKPVVKPEGKPAAEGTK